MGKQKVPKTRCCETMTEAAYRSWVKSLLRKGTLRWKPRSEALKQALRGKFVNEATNRLANHYECSECGSLVPMKQTHVDHIIPVVGEEGFTTWDDYIHRMFCEMDNLRVLCKPCHDVVTKAETAARKAVRDAKKEA